jgi:membrane-bound metal-dependent hydrolase YbcI (DUF457 family)
VGQAALFVALGLAPDLDLLVGRHSAETHSIGAAAVVASLAAWRRWPAAVTPWRIWLAVFLAWCTHPLLDSMGRDGTPPRGIMAFWPLSSEYILSPLQVFEAISRQYWLDGFVRHNTVAVLREVMLLAPALVVVWWWRQRPRGQVLNYRGVRS